MTIFNKQNYKWIVIISFFLMMFLPGQMPSPTLKTASIVLMGSIALIFEFLSLKTTQNKKETTQTWILILLTLGLIITSFVF